MSEPSFEHPRLPSDIDTLRGLPAIEPPRDMDRELVLLANDSMRARRAPIAILWTWGFESALAALTAWPFLAVVGAAYGTHPRGDAPVWRPGGLALLDLAASASGQLRSLTPLPIVALAAAAVVGLLPLALLLGQMTFATRSRRPARFAQLMPRALAAFGPLLIVFALVTLIQAIVLGGGIATGSAVSGGLGPRLGEARAAQLGGLVTLLFVLGASVLGVLHDLARASVIRFQVGALRAMKLALNTLRRGPVLIYWSWAWRGLAMLLLVILGSVVAEKSASAATGALLPLFALHQGIVLGRISLRASWLAKALRAVDFAHRVIRKGASPSGAFPTSRTAYEARTPPASGPIAPPAPPLL